MAVGVVKTYEDIEKASLKRHIDEFRRILYIVKGSSPLQRHK